MSSSSSYIRNDTSPMSSRSHQDTLERRSSSESHSVTSFGPVAIILPNFVADPDDLRHLAHGVNANDVRAAEDGGANRRGGGPVARRRGDLAAERSRQKHLARGSGEHRPSELRELVQPRQRFVGMRRLL